MSYYYQVPRWTNVVKYLIIINFAAFLLSFVAGGFLIYYFGLVPNFVWSRGWIWQFFSYMFVHSGPLHLFFNMFILWMFGSELEYHFGSREFLKYYCITGIGAGIITVLTSPHSLVPTIGASGAIFGLLLAYALYFPDRLIYVWFLIPIKAKHLVIILGAIDFMAAFSHTSTGIAHFAHLGGLLVGYLYLRTRRGWRQWLRGKWTQWWVSRRKEKMADLQDEVDRILEKIGQQGMEALTEREKRILDQASKLYDGEIK